MVDPLCIIWPKWTVHLLTHSILPSICFLIRGVVGSAVNIAPPVTQLVPRRNPNGHLSNLPRWVLELSRVPRHTENSVGEVVLRNIHLVGVHKYSHVLVLPMIFPLIKRY